MLLSSPLLRYRIALTYSWLLFYWLRWPVRLSFCAFVSFCPYSHLLFPQPVPDRCCFLCLKTAKYSGWELPFHVPEWLVGRKETPQRVHIKRKMPQIMWLLAVRPCLWGVTWEDADCHCETSRFNALTLFGGVNSAIGRDEIPPMPSYWPETCLIPFRNLVWGGSSHQIKYESDYVAENVDLTTHWSSPFVNSGGVDIVAIRGSETGQPLTSCMDEAVLSWARELRQMGLYVKWLL